MRGLDFAKKAFVTSAVLIAMCPIAAVGALEDDVAARNVCSTQVGMFAFGPAMPGQKSASFSAMITVSCPPNKEFRLKLHSMNQCRLVLGDEHVPYALFSDASHRKSLLDCGAEETEHDGRGNETFMVYGQTGVLDKFLRVGKFVDSLTLEILPDRDR